MKKIVFCDKLPALITAWTDAFADILDNTDIEIKIVHGSIFEQGVDAIVSPANSFGFMDGGLDYMISEVVGWDVQNKLRDYINKNTMGEIVVGETVVIGTSHKEIKYVISAPTMRVPMILPPDSINVYLAAKAVFHTLKSVDAINSIVISGFGTGVGQVPVQVCAKQMRDAYDDIFEPTPVLSWRDAQRKHQLLTLPESAVRDLQNPANPIW